jgi:hypothetical protein
MLAIANNDGIQIGALTCQNEQGNTQLGMGILTAVNILGSSFIGSGAQLDMSELRFATESNFGNEAVVHITGKIRAAILLVWQEQQMDSRMRMVVEDGRWKYCGGTS